MIIVFAGAGSSASVDPKKYPTTVEFFKRLPEDVRKNRLYPLVQQFLETNNNGKLIDIEDVLWTIDRFKESFDNTFDPNTITGWALNNNALTTLAQGLGGSVPDTRPICQNRELFSAQRSDLRNSINALVHGLYSERPTDNQLKNWTRLLQSIRDSGPSVEIFTTNYDLVLERATKVAGLDIEYGRKPDDLGTTIDTAIWDKSGKIPYKYGRLTKLHGSVDWQRNSDGTIVVSPVNPGSLEKQAVLYPGFKGEPEEEPFIKFHNYLREAVHAAEAAIFIGYAFRDEHINDIIRDSPRPIQKHVICKDEEPPILIPFDKDDYTYYKEGFTKDCINEILRSLNAVVGPPLPKPSAKPQPPPKASTPTPSKPPPKKN